jgi:hypothetical protein
MSIEDMKIVSAAPATYSVTACFDPYWDETPEGKAVREAAAEHRFRNEHDFCFMNGIEVHRDKSSAGVWESKEGRIFCPCGNGELEIYIPRGEYSVTYKCWCGKSEEIYSG